MERGITDRYLGVNWHRIEGIGGITAHVNNDREIALLKGKVRHKVPRNITIRVKKVLGQGALL